MPLFFLKKKHSEALSTLAAAPASTQQLQFPTNSQSHLQQPVYPWSSHAPSFGQSLSPFLRHSHTLSTGATAGELILFGGLLLRSESASNDLYVISTRDFSTTLLKISGDVPSPRYGHAAVVTNNILLIWGGLTRQQNTPDQTNDDSFYLLKFVSRRWTRVVVNGIGPRGRFGHSMTLIGSRLFVFGGCSAQSLRYFNDIWALDLNYLKSNLFWESLAYEPARGNEKPLPRAGHVSVTTGDRIIIFGGHNSTNRFNDTWSFNTSTRKWTELQCTGSIPTPRAGHAAVLLGDVMYVFGGLGGRPFGGTYVGDLTALNLSTQRWIAFQDKGPSPRARSRHAMAYDGTRVFVIGGLLSPGAHADETKLIHVLDTKHLNSPGPDSDVINSSEKTTQLVRKSSASPPIGRQPHQSSSSSDAHLAYHASPFQNATPEELDHPASQQITRRQNPFLDGLPSQPTGVSGRTRHVPDEDDDSEGSTEDHAKLVASDAPSGKGITRLENGHLIELGQQLSGTLVAKTEWDGHIGQLTDELALKSALLAQAEEEKKRAGLELRELQAKLDESLMSRDRALEQTKANVAEEMKLAGLELRELQTKFEESLMSRDHALEQTKANATEEKRRAELELRELQTKLEESLMSRDHALEQAQSALHKASRAAEANEQSQHELTEIRAELEASRSESAAFRLLLADMENGCAKCKAEASSYRNQNETGFVNINTDEDRVVQRLTERIRAMEAKMASLPGNEKSFEMMECRNED